MGLANRNDSCLRSQDSRNKVPASDVADTRDTEGAIFKVSSGETAVLSLISEFFHFFVEC